MPLGRRITSPAAKTPDQPFVNDACQTEGFTLFQAEEPQHTFDDIVLNSSTYNAIQDVLALYGKRELLFDKACYSPSDIKNFEELSALNLTVPFGSSTDWSEYFIIQALQPLVADGTFMDNDISDGVDNHAYQHTGSAKPSRVLMQITIHCLLWMTMMTNGKRAAAVALLFNNKICMRCCH